MTARLPSCLLLEPSVTDRVINVIKWMRGVFQLSFGNGDYELQMTAVNSTTCDLTLKINRFLEDDIIDRNLFKMLVNDFSLACNAVSEAKGAVIQKVQFSGAQIRDMVKPDMIINSDDVLSFVTIRLYYK